MNICVYGAAGSGIEEKYFAISEELGRKLAAARIYLIDDILSYLAVKLQINRSVIFINDILHLVI